MEYWVPLSAIRIRTSADGTRTATMRNGGNFYLKPCSKTPGSVRVLNHDDGQCLGHDTVTCRKVIVLAEDLDEAARAKAAEAAANRAAQVAAAEAAFMADPAARCGCVPQTGGWFRFGDIQTGFDATNPVHAEARRRFRADETEETARATAKAEARESWTRAFLLTWSDEMLQRFDAGLLPDSELESTVADYAFSPLNPAAAFAKLQAADVGCYCDADYDAVTFRSFPAESATAGEFAALEKLRSAVVANDRLKNAEVTLRTHVAECECGEKTTRTGILVAANCGPFPVRMEFSAE